MCDMCDKNIYEIDKMKETELVLYIDESGDPALSPGKGCEHTFVFGAVMILGANYKAVSEKWMEVKHLILGNGHKEIHMADHSHLIRGEKQERLLEFFHLGDFARIAISINGHEASAEGNEYSDKTLETAFFQLLGEQEKLCGRVFFDKIVVCFEKSSLKERLVGLCDGLKLRMIEESKGTVEDVKVEIYHIPKDSCHPCHDLADIIAHTTHRKIREINQRQILEKFVQDRYNSIFKPENTAVASHKPYKFNPTMPNE